MSEYLELYDGSADLTAVCPECPKGHAQKSAVPLALFPPEPPRSSSILKAYKVKRDPLPLG